MGSTKSAKLPEGAKARRVYLWIRDQITDGRLADGENLPGEQRLAESFGVSRVTVRRALGALSDSGRADEHYATARLDLAMYLCDALTVPASLAGLPALSLPCGSVELAGRALPVGLQLCGPPLADARVLQVGRVFQAHTSHHRRLAPGVLAEAAA